MQPHTPGVNADVSKENAATVGVLDPQSLQRSATAPIAIAVAIVVDTTGLLGTLRAINCCLSWRSSRRRGPGGTTGGVSAGRSGGRLRRRWSPRLEVVGETIDEPADVRVVLEELCLERPHGERAPFEKSKESRGKGTGDALVGTGIKKVRYPAKECVFAPFCNEWAHRQLLPTANDRYKASGK